MKTPSRDYLTIAAALIAILLCGYGIGFIVGERTTQKRLAPPDRPPGQQSDWKAITLDRLTDELDLTGEQRARAEREIRATAKTIAKTRSHAVTEYQEALLDLHQRLMPHLTDSQRRRVEESQQRLKKMLDSGKTMPEPPGD